MDLSRKFSQAPAFWRSLSWSIGFVLLYKFGGQIPVPGIDYPLVGAYFARTGHFDALAFSHRFSIFSLGLAPYFSAAILLLIAAIFSDPLKRQLLSEDGESGKFEHKILLVTLLAASVQAFFYTRWIGFFQVDGIPVSQSGFAPLTALSLVIGSLLTVWLAYGATRFGIMNGVLLFGLTDLISGAISRRSSLAGIVRSSVLSGNFPAEGRVALGIGLAIFLAAAIVLVLVFHRTRTSIGVGESAEPRRLKLSFPVNALGVIPFTAAHLVSLLPAQVLGLLDRRIPFSEPVFFWAVTFPLYLAGFAVSGWLFRWMGFDPRWTADLLARFGFIGPGKIQELTAYLDRRHLVSTLTGYGTLLLFMTLSMALGLTAGLGAGFWYTIHYILYTLILGFCLVGVGRERYILELKKASVKEWSMLTTPTTLLEARLTVRRLKEAGIESAIRSDLSVPLLGTTGLWEISVPRFPFLLLHRRLAGGSIRVLVPLESVDQARLVLSALPGESIS